MVCACGGVGVFGCVYMVGERVGGVGAWCLRCGGGCLVVGAWWWWWVLGDGGCLVVAFGCCSRGV